VRPDLPDVVGQALDFTAETGELFAYGAGRNVAYAAGRNDEIHAEILGFSHSEMRRIGLGRDVKPRRA
jgi:hypothetical protein